MEVPKDDSAKRRPLAGWEDLNILTLKDLRGMNDMINVPSSQVNQNSYIHTLLSYGVNRNCRLSCVTNRNF